VVHPGALERFATSAHHTMKNACGQPQAVVRPATCALERASSAYWAGTQLHSGWSIKWEGHPERGERSCDQKSRIWTVTWWSQWGRIRGAEGTRVTWEGHGTLGDSSCLGGFSRGAGQDPEIGKVTGLTAPGPN